MEEFVLRGKIRIDVAAEREDVFNAVRLEFLDLLVNVGMRGVHAGKVRDGLGAEILLDVADKLGGGSSRSGTARAVGHADEIGVKVSKLIKRVSK